MSFHAVPDIGNAASSAALISIPEVGGGGGGGSGAVTVIAEVPLLPSLVAVMVADPATRPVTRPFEDTVATTVLELDQVMGRPVRTVPPASRSVACNCVVCPAPTVAEAGATVTVATGAGGGAVTVMAAVPLFPSLVAVIVADPAATPVTSPVEETVAAPALEVVHVTARPVSTVPPASRSVACSCVVCPACTLAEDGATVTVATGGGGGGGAAVTVIAAVPLWPSLVAVIVAEPAPAPLTRPAVETVATEGFDVDQVTTRPLRTLPPASRAVACSWLV
jgi:hypothetical protein